MSLSAQRSRSFVDPLLGRTATLVVDGRRTNLAFARSALFHLAREQRSCVVLDIDALYASNSDFIFTPLTDAQAQGTEVIVPGPDADMEDAILNVFGSGSEKMIIIDSLNTLFHLLSTGGRSSRGRKLSFAMACLSYVAKVEKKAVLFTMYQRERASQFGRSKNISDLSDLTISASLTGTTLALKCTRGSAWPGGEFSLPTP